MRCPLFRSLVLVLACPVVWILPVAAGEVAGVVVTPHVVDEAMRFRRPRDPGLAARVQLFVQGPAAPGQFAGKAAADWLKSGDWAWHDLGTAGPIPEGALAVWTFNGKADRWGVGNEFELSGEGLKTRSIAIQKPVRWISSATFLGPETDPRPDTIVLHVVNDSDDELRLESLRLWLPRRTEEWHTLWPGEAKPLKQSIPPRERGVVFLKTAQLPLTYTALELRTSAGPLWAHVRIKRESFDISGGWVNDTLTHEPYLKLLRRLHINTGQIDHIPGYTDQPKLYEAYPIKLFNRLWPLDRWDTDEWLPRIHAVEFLGEPQFGGGRAVAPQEVFDKLLPYRVSRLPTSVTLSDERTWRWYAGLSDYPHYDAYRVVAPAADAWSEYDRWDGKRIRWGAPLETIGNMCRSLRELNRPVPCAYWSQGPHHGWGGGFGTVRTRRSPTPDELRSQALHGLASRITSLYWFNLSLRSLLKFPDTWEPIQRIGREIQMLAPYYLSGDAASFERLARADGKPDWELSTIAAPEAVLLFALDTAYEPDPKENVFVFGPPRPVKLSFPLPAWLREPKFVFRVDADGTHEAPWRLDGKRVVIEDRISRDAIYVAAARPEVRTGIDSRRKRAIQHEERHPVEEEALKAIAPLKK